MRLTLLSTVLSLTFFLFACHALPAQNGVEVLEVAAFQTKIASPKVQLVDVRTPQEFSTGHITDAQNINFYDAEFRAKVDVLDKNKPIAVYCAAGGRSSKATNVLRDLGFKQIIDLKGGMTAWKAANKPVNQ
jgi:rhodanese-related sulfurtransferase